MLRILYSIPLLISLSGCNEILRQPNLSLFVDSAEKAEMTYEVSGYDVTPEIVALANQVEFLRQVNLGGRGNGPVRRVPESSLFVGPKPMANKRFPYTLGVGDTVLIRRIGLSDKSVGVEARSVVEQTYLVGENGAIELNEGRSVVVENLKVSEAQSALQAALSSVGKSSSNLFEEIEFPKTRHDKYKLGPGDVIRVMRLFETTDSAGKVSQTIERSESVIGQDGIVSIIQLGEIEVEGLTLNEVRDRVVQEAVRNATGANIVVEISQFASQTVFVTGEFGTNVVPITDQPLTFDRLIAGLNLPMSGGIDYSVQLDRGKMTYQMLASDILYGRDRDTYLAKDGDRVRVSSIVPDSKIQLEVSNVGTRKLTYLRVSDDNSQSSQQGRVLSVNVGGIDLRELLISQAVDINHDEDLLVSLTRDEKTYRISAQSAILDQPSQRYWLKPEDHVVVEDIAYVANSALLVGEISAPKLMKINQHSRTTLSKALFEGGVFGAANADFKHIYVLRGSGAEYKAYHFDISQVLNLSLAEKFELRPGDIMFVRTRPLTRYNRALALALTFFGSVDTGIQQARTFGEPN